MAISTPSIHSSLRSSPKLCSAPRLSGSASGHGPVFFLRLRGIDFPSFASSSISLRSARNHSRISTSAAPETSQKADSRVSTIVEVDLGNRSYPIYIGSGLLDEPDLLQRHVHGKRVLVVTNTTIAPLYLDKVTKALTYGNSNVSVESVILPDGEAYKNMAGQLENLSFDRFDCDISVAPSTSSPRSAPPATSASTESATATSPSRPSRSGPTRSSWV